ncbi:MAG: hypothetical protein HQK65_13345 [Desulfamplus sp.]|nr:hypothetical protein [Desulfamplus sp.]
MKITIEFNGNEFEKITEAIKEGVADAFYISSVKKVIRAAIIDSMPYPSEIKGAIYEGAKDAVSKQ